MKHHNEEVRSFLFGFEDTLQVSLRDGVDSGEVPPVPIPNTEVKLTGVDNTWLATAWEDRYSPSQRGN